MCQKILILILSFYHFTVFCINIYTVFFGILWDTENEIQNSTDMN
jgi:hypothetical protein